MDPWSMDPWRLSDELDKGGKGSLFVDQTISIFHFPYEGHPQPSSSLLSLNDDQRLSR